MNLNSELLKGLTEEDQDFSLLQAKDCLFRINRDVRFSKDKSPYKTNFGIALSPGGKKSGRAGYYVHISENNSFIGGGIWMPDAKVLNDIRQEIDYNWDEFKAIIDTQKFKKNFHFDGEKLLRPPKGYDASNPAIDFLKYKSFTVFKSISLQALESDDLVQTSLEAFKDMKHFIQFLNRVFD